jgi:ferredoxin
MAQRITEGLERGIRRPLAAADAFFNRLYGSRLNPFYHSGALVVALLLVLLATGLYLLLFYRTGAPYESVARVTDQAWLGRWIRGVHRYASAASVVAIAVHALRMFAQGRSWGPRAMAWISGVLLLGVFMLCGWTGYVIVWDVQAQVMAMEAARLLDGLPLFSEPIARAFSGEQPLPDAFFFMNLFLHVALPVGLGLLLWLHVARNARPALLPPRKLMWGVIGLLTAAAILWPVTMAPEADLLRMPERAPFDAFYAFWIPFTQALPTGISWALILGITLALFLVPALARPRRRDEPERPAPLPSQVDERLCTGCEQCVHDCPYEAIAMRPRSDGRETEVAVVDPALCVSCGICAGSCAPMGIGPPGRTGRDQLATIRTLLSERKPGPRDVVVIGCTRGGGGAGRERTFAGAPVHPVHCAGNLHTSVIEMIVRSGAGGVIVLSCHPRDCWNREGAKWLEERMYHDREAELQPRVDRRRVRLVHASEAETALAEAAVARFGEEVRVLAAPAAEEEIDLLALCERGEVSP